MHNKFLIVDWFLCKWRYNIIQKINLLLQSCKYTVNGGKIAGFWQKAAAKEEGGDAPFYCGIPAKYRFGCKEQAVLCKAHN